MASGARMGVSDKFRGERTRKRGGSILFDMPSITIAGFEKDLAGGEKDHRMVFWMKDIMTHKILKKNLFVY